MPGGLTVALRRVVPTHRPFSFGNVHGHESRPYSGFNSRTRHVIRRDVERTSVRPFETRVNLSMADSVILGNYGNSDWSFVSLRGAPTCQSNPPSRGTNSGRSRCSPVGGQGSA